MHSQGSPHTNNVAVTNRCLTQCYEVNTSQKEKKKKKIPFIISHSPLSHLSRPTLLPADSPLPCKQSGNMIVPRINLAADDYAEQLSAFSILPNQVLVTPTPDHPTLQAVLKTQNKDAYWVQPLSFDPLDPLAQIHSLLDAGADKVVLPYAAFATGVDSFAHIPQERLAVALSPADFAHVDQLLGTVSLYILDVDTSAESLEAIKAVAQVVQKGLLPRGGIKRVVAAFSGQGPASTPGLLAISELGRMSVDTLLSGDILSTDHQDGKLNLGEAFMATVVSDRPDGLFATVVVDEQGISLGLVYSSLESVVESFRTRKGVYFSRSRGLWHKGASSGSTQDLIKVHVDCDSDALQFTVHQHGTGKTIQHTAFASHNNE